MLIKKIRQFFSGKNNKPIEGELEVSDREEETEPSRGGVFGFFSTDTIFQTPNYKDFNHEYAFPVKPTDFNWVKRNESGDLVACDESEVPALDYAIKNAFNLSGQAANSALISWYVSQGFIGHQSCALIAQQWLVNKACLVPAQDAMRKGWEITVNDGSDMDPKMLSKIRKLDKKYKVNANLVEFEQFNRVFGIRIALFKVKSKDKKYYEKPFNIDGVRAGSYEGIVQVDPYWITPELDAESTGDPSSIDFYEPTYWSISGKRYHKSHLIITRYAELPDLLKPSYQYGGLPMTQLIYERVYSSERTANEAPMLAMTKRTTAIHVDMEAAVANQANFEKKMNTWTHYRDNYGIKVLGLEEKIDLRDTSLADLDAVIMTQYQIVSSIANVPATKLLGTTPKGFNATGEYEESSYHESLETIQTDTYDPLLERHYMLLAKSDLDEDIEIEVRWNPLEVMSDKEWAELNNQKAQADNVYFQAGAIDGYDIRQRLITDKNSGYNGLEMPDDDDSLNPPNEMEEETGLDAMENNRGYVSVKPRREDALAIFEAAARAGFTDIISPDDMHVTLYYSKTGLPNVQVKYSDLYLAKLTDEVRIMGEGEYRAVVIVLDSPDLQKRFAEIDRLGGGQHSFDNYVPHISLKYGATDEDLAFAENLDIDRDMVILSNETAQNALVRE